MLIKEIQYECVKRNIPFYCYRLPGTEEIVTGIQRTSKIDFFDGFPEANEQKGFLIAPFILSGKPLFIREDFRIINDTPNETFERWIRSVHFEAANSETEEYAQTQDEYLKEISDLIQQLQEDKLSKVVFSRIIALKNNSENNYTLFQDLARNYPEAFVFSFHLPGKAVWMGATPELFLQVRPGTIKTVALAGTRKISDNSWNDKEYEEHAYVSKFIRNVLDDYSLTNRTESQPKSVYAGECAHLKTEFSIDADLSGQDIVRLIKSLHPTPAVCGYPQKEAMDEIVKREKHNRAFYTGFLGPVDAVNRIDLFVNLRCIKIGEKQIVFFVGGGITKDSEPQKEWDETVLKAQTIMKFF